MAAKEKEIVDHKALAERVRNLHEEFPAMFTAMSEVTIARRKEVLQDIADALDAGEFPNAKFADFKYTMAEVLRQYWASGPSDPNYNNRPEALYMARAGWSANGYSSGPSLRKKLEKFAKLYPEEAKQPHTAPYYDMLAFTDLMFVIGTRLKETAVKKVQKTEAERKAEEVYVQPYVSPASQKKVHDVLVALTESKREEMEEAYASGFRKSLQNALEKQYEPYFRANYPYYAHMISMFGKSVEYPERRGRYYYVAHPDAEAMIKKHAQQASQRAQEVFVAKNLNKLRVPIDAKGNLKSVELIDNNLRMDRLEGKLRVTFEDGSRFDVHNQLVFVTNQNETQFWRFPLTYHNVIDSAGALVAKKRSEEEMGTQPF